MKHYRKKDPEPIHVIHTWNLGYYEGNILKYLARWKDKGQERDLLKLGHYCWFLIQSYSLGEIKDLSNPIEEHLNKFLGEPKPGEDPLFGPDPLL